MKNLHKKIGVVVLAGMALFGGIAASGVRAYAIDGGIFEWESEDSKKLEEVKDIGRKKGFRVVLSAEKGRPMDLLIKLKYAGDVSNELLLSGNRNSFVNRVDFENRILDVREKSGRRLIRVEFRGREYVIFFSK